MTGREVNRRFLRLILSGFISVLRPRQNRLAPPESTTASRDGPPAFVGTVWISRSALPLLAPADLSARRHNGDGFVRWGLPARSREAVDRTLSRGRRWSGLKQRIAQRPRTRSGRLRCETR